MKLPKFALFVALLSPVLLSPAFAQRGGGGHGGGGGGGRASGGFSGGGGGRASGGFSGGGGARGGFSGGGVRGGGGYYGGRGFYGGRYYGGGLYLGLGGWGYPYYGYGYPYYAYGYDPYAYGYDPYGYGGGYYSTPSAPPATIPQNYGYPPPQVQTQPAPQQLPPQSQPQAQPQAATPADQGQFYLIAFNDHSIQAATAYKVDGDQLHWITREGQEKQAPMSSIDVRFSEQINRDRGVNFQIP